MLDSFRGDAFVRECPDGAVVVARGAMPAGGKFLYQSADSNDIGGVYSVKAFSNGGISVLNDGLKYKRVSPMKKGKELMTDSDLLEGAEVGIYHSDPIAVPLGLMRVRGAIVEWDALEVIGEKLDKEGFVPPLSPLAVVGYPNLSFDGQEVVSSVYKLENVDFDIRFTEFIEKLVSRMRRMMRAEIELIAPMLIDIFMNLNKSRGANARLMYDLGIIPSREAMVCENYSVVNFAKDGEFGLFFHDHDSTVLGEKCDLDLFLERLDYVAVPKVVLVLAFLEKFPKISFTNLHDFLSSIELLRDDCVANSARLYVQAFLAGFDDCLGNLGTVPQGKWDFINAILS